MAGQAGVAESLQTRWLYSRGYPRCVALVDTAAAIAVQAHAAEDVPIVLVSAGLAHAYAPTPMRKIAEAPASAKRYKLRAGLAADSGRGVRARYGRDVGLDHQTAAVFAAKGGIACGGEATAAGDERQDVVVSGAHDL